MRLTGCHPRLVAVLLAMAGLLALAAPPAGASPPPGANDFGCRPSAADPAPVVLVHGTFETVADNWALVAPQIKAAG
jgi:hypothetical protein